MKKIIIEEEKRLNSIKVPIPEIICNNFMTDSERTYFILGQKTEFQILTNKKLGD